MTVKDYMRHTDDPSQYTPGRPRVMSESHILEALGTVAGSSDGSADVCGHDGKVEGRITGSDMLSALNDIFAPGLGCSLIEVECDRNDYSASRLAMAVEDADVSLLGLWRMPYRGRDAVSALMMIDSEAPAAACRSLRRYGYSARPAAGVPDENMQLALNNIEALKMYLEM